MSGGIDVQVQGALCMLVLTVVCRCHTSGTWRGSVIPGWTGFGLPVCMTFSKTSLECKAKRKKCGRRG